MDNILTWKKKYGRIFTNKYPGVEKEVAVVYRTLTMSELSAVYSLADSPDMDEDAVNDLVVDVCVLNVREPSKKLKVGAVASLARSILGASSPLDEKAIRERMKKGLDDARSNLVSHIICDIMSVFPACNPLELNNLTFDKLLEARSLAHLLVEKNTAKPGQAPPQAQGQGAKSQLSPVVEAAQMQAADNLNAALGKDVPTIESKKRTEGLPDKVRAKNKKIEELV